jgi:hypothetical protein
MTGGEGVMFELKALKTDRLMLKAATLTSVASIINSDLKFQRNYHIILR